MKFEIMLSILLHLLSNKSISAKYLAEKYQVSQRTIYRYINCLELAGVPLYTTRGNGGGISIVDTYRLSSTFLSENEFEHTIEALNAIANEVGDETLENVVLKLKANVKNEYSGFDIKSGNLLLDGGSWGDTEGYKSKLKVISDAISDTKQLSIIYHDRNGNVSNRVINPHILVFKQGLWYVYAYCNLREKFRFFKVGRIESANTLNSTFVKIDIKRDDIPLSFWNQNNSIDVCLEIENNVLSDVQEWLGVENITKEKRKNIARVKLPNDNGLVMKIMGFGSGIKVISPKELKDKIIDNSRKIISQY